MSKFIVAEATPRRFQEVTGLIQHLGFDLHKGMPGGLYFDAHADQIHGKLLTAGVNHNITPAETVSEGLRKVFGDG